MYISTDCVYISDNTDKVKRIYTWVTDNDNPPTDYIWPAAAPVLFSDLFIFVSMLAKAGDLAWFPDWTRSTAYMSLNDIISQDVCARVVIKLVKWWSVCKSYI
jgi:hypothetical protein